MYQEYLIQYITRIDSLILQMEIIKQWAKRWFNRKEH